MKSKCHVIRRAKWFLPVVIAIVVVSIGSGVFAATFSSWQTANVSSASSVGSLLTVIAKADTSNFDWSIAGTDVATVAGTNFMVKFSPITAIEGTKFTTNSNAMTINNTGNVNITGWNVSDVVNGPLGSVLTGLTITPSNTPIAAGSSGILTLTLTGMAPALSPVANQYDLGGITFKLIPTGP